MTLDRASDPSVETSDSFWEIGQYKRCVRRLEDGHRLCNDLMKVLHERLEIEKAYAKNLQQWSDKWSDSMTKSPEYGTSKDAWMALFGEAAQVSRVHHQIRDSLLTNSQSVKKWQKQTYSKTLVGGMKEIKELEEQFKRAQKPWSQRLDRCNKSKKEYHNACKSERSAINQERNAKNDTAQSVDQQKKFAEKVELCKQQVSSHKQKYEDSLEELDRYRDKYIQDMREVFKRCQEQEAERLQFIRRTLLEVQRSLDFSTSQDFTRIYPELEHRLKATDYRRDLEYWALHFGAEMPANWPVFEEYRPELAPISKKSKTNKDFTASDGVMLTGIVRQTGGDSPPPTPDADESSEQQYQRQSSRSSGGGGPPPPAGTIETTSDYSSHNATNTSSSENSHHSGSLSRHPDIPLPSSSAEYATIQQIDQHEPTQSQTHPAPGPPPPQPSNSHLEPDEAGSPLLPPAEPVVAAENRNGIGHNPTAVLRDSSFSEDWSEDHELVDEGRNGVQVRALYDYSGSEDDELTFHTGDVMEKLSDEDEQGWCKARFKGKVGLYPATYCTVIE